MRQVLPVRTCTTKNDDLASAALRLWFHNLTRYIARSLLESGGFRPRPHPGL
jgi:hypothetical protein